MTRERAVNRLRRVRRQYLAAAAVGLIAACGLAVSSAVRSANSPTDVTFTTVSPQQLAEGGIQLSTPQNAASPSANATEGQTAEAAARSWFGGIGQVLESHYAHCVDSTANPPISEDCWAVSLDPTNIAAPTVGPPANPPGVTTDTTATTTTQQAARPSYMIVLVDPSTNKVLEAQSG
jgi:hypothetical protein